MRFFIFFRRWQSINTLLFLLLLLFFFSKGKTCSSKTFPNFCKSPNFSQSSRDPILPWRFPNFSLTNIYAFFNHLLSWYARYVRIKFHRRKKNFGSLVQVGLWWKEFPCPPDTFSFEWNGFEFRFSSNVCDSYPPAKSNFVNEDPSNGPWRQKNTTNASINI